MLQNNFFPDHRLAWQVWVKISFKEWNYKLLSKSKFVNRGAVIVYLFVGSQLPEWALFVKSNIPSLFKHPYLTRSDGMRKTPSSFCAFEFWSGRDGTEDAWRSYRESRCLCVKPQNSEWVCPIFVRSVIVSVVSFYHVYLQTSDSNMILTFCSGLFYLSNFGVQTAGSISHRPRHTTLDTLAEPF